jgi:hypothetical protein
MRTDVHKPSSIDPSDYEYVAQEMLKIEGFDDCAAILENRKRITDHMAQTGGTYAHVETTGNCMVCGSVNAIWTSLFYHAKSNSYVRMGTDCTEKVYGQTFGAGEFRKSVEHAREASKGKRKAIALLTEWGLENAWTHYTAGIVDRVPTWDEMTATDIVGKLVKYGSISEKQISFLRSLMEKIANAAVVTAKRIEEKALAANCPRGKVQITGTVLTTKEQESIYGITWKMLVKHATGYTVWGTIPSSISDVSKGAIVTFTATVEPSNNDPKHGFYKRPTQATINQEGNL